MRKWIPGLVLILMIPQANTSHDTRMLGNASYAISSLDKHGNDVNDMGYFERHDGFEVSAVGNANQGQTENVIGRLHQPHGLEPEMAPITAKGKCFRMGSPESEAERMNNNERQHEVCFDKDFEIGKYEVTQAQWMAIMGDNPSYFKGGDMPVEHVNWKRVQIYIQKLNQRTGKIYRLPTEAEWEYAARAGTTTPFYTGDCIHTDQANYDGNSDYNECGAKTGVRQGQTVAVGSYPANPWGLYDMAGNLWEWTCSVYVDKYDGSERDCALKNQAALARALRGGSWSNSARGLRSAARGAGGPGYHFAYWGFRLAAK